MTCLLGARNISGWSSIIVSTCCSVIRFTINVTKHLPPASDYGKTIYTHSLFTPHIPAKLVTIILPI